MAFAIEFRGNLASRGAAHKPTELSTIWDRRRQISSWRARPTVLRGRSRHPFLTLLRPGPKWPALALRPASAPLYPPRWRGGQRAHGGAVAQLGERRNRTAEVRGSNPLGSTSLRSLRELRLGRPYWAPFADRYYTGIRNELGRPLNSPTVVAETVTGHRPKCAWNLARRRGIMFHHICDPMHGFCPAS